MSLFTTLTLQGRDPLRLVCKAVVDHAGLHLDGPGAHNPAVAVHHRPVAAVDLDDTFHLESRNRPTD